MAEILVKGKPWHYEATDYYSLSGEHINKEESKELLLRIKKVLDDNSIRFFPNYGTLLGIIREHDFIGHDSDSDMTIWENDRKKMIDLIPEFDKNEVKFVRCSEPWVYTFQYNNSYCDIDVIHKAQWPYNYRYCMEEECYIPKYFFSEMIKQEFLGVNFEIPKKSEKLLAYYYGKNWRIPGGRHSRIQTYLLVHINLYRFAKRCIKYIKRKFLN